MRTQGKGAGFHHVAQRGQAMKRYIMWIMRFWRFLVQVPPPKPDLSDMLLRRGIMLHNRDMTKAKAYRDKNLKLRRIKT